MIIIYTVFLFRDPPPPQVSGSAPASPNEAYGINRESANKLEVDVTNPNKAYGIANRLEVDVTSPNEAYGITNRGSAMEDYVETDIAAHTSRM